MRYEEEQLHRDEDDGTMVESLKALSDEVVGHRIVSVDQEPRGIVITLDNGKRVVMVEVDDCCAYTEVETFLLNPDLIDHVIIGVGTTDGYTTWHIYADLGDVLQLTVGWSCGNPFYYGYGFDIVVKDC
jgi:hypothetical protein